MATLWLLYFAYMFYSLHTQKKLPKRAAAMTSLAMITKLTISIMLRDEQPWDAEPTNKQINSCLKHIEGLKLQDNMASSSFCYS